MFIRRSVCPGCAGEDFHQIHETSYGDPDLHHFLASYYSKAEPSRLFEATRDGFFTVLACRTCDLLFQRDVPDDALLMELYGEWLGKNDELAPHQPPMPLSYYSYMAQEIMQLVATIRNKVGERRRLKFLDYGQGWGNWAQMARAFGVDIYGVELSPEKVAYAESLGLKVIGLEDMENHQFDFINTEQVIEHLVEPRAILKVLKDCLAPAGILKLSVPNGGNTAMRLRKWTWKDSYVRRDQIMAIHPLEHLNCFSGRSLVAMAESCGLRRFSIPLSVAYGYTTDWMGVKAAAKNIMRPVKRFVIARGNYALFAQ